MVTQTADKKSGLMDPEMSIIGPQIPNYHSVTGHFVNYSGHRWVNKHLAVRHNIVQSIHSIIDQIISR